MRETVFEFLEQTFVPAEGDLLQATAQNVSPTESTSRFQFDTFFEAVFEEQLCPHPDHDGWYCVPIHDEETPILTGEYVVFVDHQLRGQRVLLADPEKADQHTAFNPDEFSEFALVNQLRFWDSSFYTEGTEQARGFATTMIAKTDCTESTESLDEGLERLNAAIQGLEYALEVDHDLPSVERATIERQQETLSECLNQLQATKQQARIQTAASEIQRHIERGDDKLDARDYDRALSAYRDGEERLNQIRRDLGDAVETDEQIATISQQLSDKIQTAQLEQQRGVVDDLQTTAAETEERAHDAEEDGDYLQARALYREAKETYEQARDAATRLPERRDELDTVLDRVSDRIEAAESEYYHAEITAALEEASRHERLGDELSEMDARDDAVSEYEQALTHANRAVDLADEGGVLEAETASCKEALQRKHTAVKSERDRRRVEQLIDQATTLEQEDAAETSDQTVSIDTLKKMRQLLIKARNLAKTTDGIDATSIESRLSDIASRYRMRRNEQNEQAIEGEISAAEEQYEAGERSLKAGEPLTALQSFRNAKQDYVALRESLPDRGLDEFDVRLKARLSQLETELQTARQDCQTRLKTILDSAENAVEDAKSHRERGDYEAAESVLGDALQEYQEAHRIASELQSDQLHDIRSRFRDAESEIKSLQAVPAKIAIQNCIEHARANVQAGHTAQRQGHQVNARELYGDALYFIEETLDIVNEYNLGTTVDIGRHNLRILTRNKQKIEAAQRDVGQATGDVGSSAPPEIENVTEHLRPPNTLADEADIDEGEPRAAESPSESAESAETEALDIYNDIMSEFDDISEL